jgi:hypothetical protein
LEILNRGDEPTFVTRVRQEMIDITLSTDIKREIYNWRVMTEVFLSDHRIIRFKFISDYMNTETLALQTGSSFRANWPVRCKVERYCKHLYNG